MKRIFLSALILLFLLSSALPVSAYTMDKTFNAVRGTAVIDGEPDSIYFYSDPLEIKNFFNFANSGAEEHLADMATGVAYMVWDPDFIYVYYEITDVTISDTETESESTDAIEFVFDFGNNHTNGGSAAESYGPYGFFMKITPYYTKYGKDPTWKYAVSDYNTWLLDNGYEIAVKTTDTGYIIEQKFPAYPENPALASGFGEGYTFGYAVCILDDVDDDGMRDIKISWGLNDKEPMGGNMMTNGECTDRIRLAPAPVIETEPAETETDAAPEAPAASSPQTFDAVTVLFAAAALSAAGIAAGRKRRG